MRLRGCRKQSGCVREQNVLNECSGGLHMYTAKEQLGADAAALEDNLPCPATLCVTDAYPLRPALAGVALARVAGVGHLGVVA